MPPVTSLLAKKQTERHRDACPAVPYKADAGRSASPWRKTGAANSAVFTVNPHGAAESRHDFCRGVSAGRQTIDVVSSQIAAVRRTPRSGAPAHGPSARSWAAGSGGERKKRVSRNAQAAMPAFRSHSGRFAGAASDRLGQNTRYACRQRTRIAPPHSLQEKRIAQKRPRYKRKDRSMILALMPTCGLGRPPLKNEGF